MMSFWKKLFGLQDESSDTKLSPGLDQWFDKVDTERRNDVKPKIELIEATKKPRKNYEASCRHLQTIGYLKDGEIPPHPKSKPRYDDEEIGFSLFRYMCEGVDFSNLTLSRTFFGKSELSHCSFLNTDLSESVLCWNDFIAIDFSYADLSNADLRAADFEKVSFRNANLSKADLRLSDYSDCDFEGAIMTGAILSEDMKDALNLSDKQISEINWQDEVGEEPDGG